MSGLTKNLVYFENFYSLYPRKNIWKVCGRIISFDCLLWFKLLPLNIYYIVEIAAIIYKSYTIEKFYWVNHFCFNKDVSPKYYYFYS